jgi:hypothetical protein
MIKTVFLIPRTLKKLQFMSWCLYVSTVRLLEMMRPSVFTRCKYRRTKAKKEFREQKRSNKSEGEAGGKAVNGFS